MRHTEGEPKEATQEKYLEPRKILRENVIGVSIWNFSLSWIFSRFFVGWSKKEKEKTYKKYLQGFGAFERSRWMPFNDMALDIAGAGFKTEPTTLHQTGGVRLSETKGAHKS